MGEKSWPSGLRQSIKLLIMQKIHFWLTSWILCLLSSTFFLIFFPHHLFPQFSSSSHLLRSANCRSPRRICCLQLPIWIKRHVWVCDRLREPNAPQRSLSGHRKVVLQRHSNLRRYVTHRLVSWPCSLVICVTRVYFSISHRKFKQFAVKMVS